MFFGRKTSKPVPALPQVKQPNIHDTIDQPALSFPMSSSGSSSADTVLTSESLNDSQMTASMSFDNISEQNDTAPFTVVPSNVMIPPPMETVPIPTVSEPIPSGNEGRSTINSSLELEAFWSNDDDSLEEIFGSWDSVDEFDPSVMKVGEVIHQVRDLLDVAQPEAAFDTALDYTQNDVNAANALISLVEDAHVSVHQFGEVLVRARQPSGELWVLLDGTADAYRMSGNEARPEPYSLKSGDAFGSLTPGDFELETISATSPCRAIHFSTDLLLRVVARLPNLSNQLQMLAEHRICDLIFGPNSIFAGLSETDRFQVLSMLRRCSFAAGEHLTEEGHRNNYLYFIASGRVASYQQIPGIGEQQIATLYSGDCIGEASLLRQCTANARTQALTQVTAFLLDRPGFLMLMHNFPTVKKALIELAGKRIDENAARLRHATAPLPPLEVKAKNEPKRVILTQVSEPPHITNIRDHRETSSKDLDPLGSLGQSRFLDDD